MAKDEGYQERIRSSLFMVSWSDIKLSLRLLIRNPGLTVVSTVGITVGIAITAGMFGFVHATFAPTLPLDEGDRIIALENWDVAKNNEDRQSLHDFVTWRDQTTSVVDISAFRTITGTMQTGDRLPETVRVAAMSPSGFRVARVPALVGRFLTPDDAREAAPPVVVIGYDVWQSRFGQDRGVIGQQASARGSRSRSRNGEASIALKSCRSSATPTSMTVAAMDPPRRDNCAGSQ